MIAVVKCKRNELVRGAFENQHLSNLDFSYPALALMRGRRLGFPQAFMNPVPIP